MLIITVTDKSCFVKELMELICWKSVTPVDDGAETVWPATACRHRSLLVCSSWPSSHWNHPRKKSMNCGTVSARCQLVFPVLIHKVTYAQMYVGHARSRLPTRFQLWWRAASSSCAGVEACDARELFFLRGRGVDNKLLNSLKFAHSSLSPRAPHTDTWTDVPTR